MEAFWLFPVLAIVVEALTEYGKNLLMHENRKTLIVQMCALGISIALCVLSGADVLAEAGVTFRLPYIGSVLTGIFASRGANYASDILKRIQSGNGKDKTE